MNYERNEKTVLLDEHDRAIKCGYKLAHPPPGDNIVVTGLAGRFPDSDDVYHFRDNLFNKVDLVSDDTRRWEKFHEEIPQRTGKINNVTKLDAGYFGLHQRHLNYMDPLVRLMLEKAVEAVIDAGINPTELKGTNTGVYIGICASETEKEICFDKTDVKSYSILGCVRSQAAQRISYHLKLNGPSFICDSACSSSSYALELAYRELRQGKCDQAIVGGINLCLLGSMSLQFARLGMLSPDGTCRSFDDDANGYVRSEAVCALLLQKEKHARRIYARVVHSKVNSDGYKSEGITYPSGASQTYLMKEFYKECSISPSAISFLEAHGTGTKVGDPEEVLAIASVFCKDRSSPLLIGTVKSNIGHTEPTSGLCSLAKVVFSMETGLIPPNINFKTPRRDVEALNDGRIKVITEITKWIDDNGLAAINNFGFGGANCHFLLEHNKKLKVNDGKPVDDLPRLVCLSGRTTMGIDAILDDIKSRTLDEEHIRLYQEIFSKTMLNERYRAYSVLTKNGELERSINVCAEKRTLCFVFQDFDKCWPTVGKDLLNIPIFKNKMQRIQNILDKIGVSVNILGSILNYSQGSIMESLLCMTSIQLGLIDIMNTIDIIPEFLIGNSLGEFVCAYYEGLLTLEQIIETTCCMASANSKQYTKYSARDTYFSIISDLTRIITISKCRFTKWIHNCEERNEVNLLDALVNAVIDPFELEKLYKTLPDKTLMVFFGPNQTDFSRSSICLVNFEAANSLHSLLSSLGSLYQHGINFNAAHLYPEVKWPVSKGTPMISPKLKWDYSHDWYVTHRAKESTNTVCVYVINTQYKDWAYLKGHVIDGNTLFPASGYLYLVWNCFAKMVWTTCTNLNIVFENVMYLRAANISKKRQVSLRVSISSEGEFEVTEKGDHILVTGRVSSIEKECDEFIDISKLGDLQDNDQLPLLRKDIYKELKLRGYMYSGAFRGIEECNNMASKGILKWDHNWVTFIDSMLQLSILQKDTRNLYVPTGIQKVLISTKRHNSEINSDGTVNVYVRKNANIISSGGVQILGITVSPISKRKLLAEPVLESYQFVPNEGILTLEQCIRVDVQVILENSLELGFKLVEVLNNQNSDTEPLCGLFQQVLSDQPMIQPDIKLLTNQPLDLPGVTTENSPLTSISNYLVVVGIKLLTNSEMLVDATKAVSENGYIISREDKFLEPSKVIPDIKILTQYKTELETIVLLKKCKSGKLICLEVDNCINKLGWIPKLQELYKTDSTVVVISQNDKNNGVLGFVNCLRREAGGSQVRCIFIVDEVPKVNLNEEFYDEQMKKGFAINVLKNHQWGTYRHLLMNSSKIAEAEHAFLKVINPGDLSSLAWVEGPAISNSILEKDRTLIHVYYSALNFRDILTASGRLPVDIGINSRLAREGFQGLEFAGRDPNGKRVFGMTQRGGLSTVFAADSFLLWDIPDEWTMEEAVTLPVVYSTVLYALIDTANIQRGQSILIHAGSGGIGQAAINVASHYGCTIFTTVGSKEKKSFLRKHFPQIKEEHIGNSRDTSFEQMIYKHTNGRGVDIALNSLAEEKLQATIRCVARGGNYLEIGKIDLIQNKAFNLKIFERGIKATGVMLDLIFNVDTKKNVSKLLLEYVKSGAVKPLHRVVYGHEQIESAYRFMAGGKHMGKIVIKLRSEEQQNVVIPGKRFLKCLSVFYCNPNSTYVIVGGLGGFGLELADWLIIKGCKKLVLVSRHGVTTGYQALRLRFWQQYTSSVHISREDVTTRNGCINLLKESNALGPVEGIFNLAVVLEDALFGNQTIETFETSLKPKAVATKYLDEVSRQDCPSLRHFVIFSSVSAGRGNPGQTNYGLANSIMERICENRRADAYPALAVQWGAVGDVGLVAEMNEINRDVIIGGTLQQRVANCLEVLDSFLCQDQAVVSSMVVAEKTTGGNIEEVICNILGIKDMKTINLQSSLPELGMDSITGLEIKQLIERQFDITLTPQDMKSMTFLRLKELSQNKDIQSAPPVELDWLNLLLKNMKQSNICDVPLLQLKTSGENGNSFPEVSFIPGVEGMSTVFEPLASKLNCQAYGCQLLFKYPNENICLLAKEVIKYTKRNTATFTMVAYSYGCLVALEVMALLEKEGYLGNVIFIDGAPHLFKEMIKGLFAKLDEEAFKTLLLIKMLQNTSFAFTKDFEDKFSKYTTFNQKMDFLIANVSDNKNFSSEYLRQSFDVIYDRIRSAMNYEPSFTKLKSKVKLLRPKISFDLGEDYKLSCLFESPVEVKTFETDHEKILTSAEVAREISSFINCIKL